MKVLVSNIGSTSFKFRLFDMAEREREIAVGGADRIGGKGGVLKLRMCGAGILPACGEGVPPSSLRFLAVSSLAQQQQDADKMSATHEAGMASARAGETPATHAAGTAATQTTGGRQ